MGAMFATEAPLPAGLPPEAVRYLAGTQPPPWADLQKLAAAHRFFVHFAWPISTGLHFSSLPQAYAAAKGARVLARTEQMTRNVRQRILGTAQFLFDVMERGALLPGGNGVRAAQKVRLVHAAVRYRLLRASPTWNTNELGAPVNQEDLAGTLLTFSLVPLDALDKLGFKVSNEEAEAWLHAWTVVGFFLGIDERLLPDEPTQARELMVLIRDRQWAPSPEGRALIRPLLSMLQQSFPGQVLPGLPVAMIRYLAGDRCADVLGLPPTNWTLQALRAAERLGPILKGLDVEAKALRRFGHGTHRLMQTLVRAEQAHLNGLPRSSRA
jgi:hypothetical protein